LDSSQRSPDLALEGCAACFDRQTVDHLKIACKIPADRICQTIRITIGFEPESVLAIVEAEQPLHTCFVIAPIRGTQIPVLIRDDQHFSDGRPNSICQELQDICHALLLLLIRVAWAAQRCCAA